MIHPSHNLRSAQAYFKTLSPDDISVRYRNMQSLPQVGLWTYLKILINPGKYYDELHRFYPNQHVINRSREIFEHDQNNAFTNGIIASGLLSVVMFQFARRGKILPILKKYGHFFKNHRILRQYFWAILLPPLTLKALTNWDHASNVHQLWSVHARRMQKGQFDDPQGTQYHSSTVDRSWKNEVIQILDYPLKLRNQVQLQNSPDYTLPQFQAVDIGQDQGEEQEDQE